MSSTKGDIDDLKNELTIIIAAIGGVIIALVVVTIVIVSVICAKISRVAKGMDILHISLRSIQKDMSQVHQAIDRLPKNIIQFPITKTVTTVVDDDDRAGTEPASPIFYRKGFTPTPLASSSLTSVTEIPTGNQAAHHPLQRNNAIFPPHRTKQIGPPVPPKRAHSFNTHSFNY